MAAPGHVLCWLLSAHCVPRVQRGEATWPKVTQQRNAGPDFGPRSGPFSWIRKASRFSDEGVRLSGV